MDAEVAKALEDLGNRISVQENLHRNFMPNGKTTDGGSHGIIGNLPVILCCVAVAALVAVIIVNQKTKPSNG